ncbi:MAG: metal-sulfur cluster assembly factor [Candidatus Micrarchaeota archaeon]|nr:metal-sulfur cluster assembly factor [Candidatus Micrarchaeota archaeon]
MVSIRQVTDVLKKCVDPELGINIVDLGLIHDIKIDKQNNVVVKLTMTSPMCPVTSVIMADAELRLEEIPDHGEIKLELEWEPMWTPEMISRNIRATMMGM